MAPKNCDSFYVLSPVPNLKSGINWNLKGTIQKKILEALEKTILPNLSKNLTVCFHMSPEDFKKIIIHFMEVVFLFLLYLDNQLGLDFITNLKVLTTYIL